MSNRIEWADAGSVEFEVYPEGTEFAGYEEPITAPFGLYIEFGGAGAVVEGSMSELLDMLARAMQVVVRGANGANARRGT